MATGATFDYGATAAGLSPTQAYAIVERWISARGGKVRAKDPPRFIEASHGTKLQMIGWKANARKTLRFEIRTVGAVTMVQVRVIPSWMYSGDIEALGMTQARVNFGHLIDGLWALLGNEPAVREGERRALATRSENEGKARMLTGAGLVTLGVLITVLLAPRGPNSIGSLWYAAYWGTLWGGGMLFIQGVLAYRAGRRFAEKNRR